MGKPRVLVITTALRHKHRYRLHNFLPHLKKYLSVDVVDIAPLGYDMYRYRSTLALLSRAIKELISEPYRCADIEHIKVFTIRSLAPGDFGAISTLPTYTILLHRLRREKYNAVLASPFLAGIHALYACYRIDIPLIYEDVDRFYDFFKNSAKRLIAKALEYHLIRSSHAVIAASPELYMEDLQIRNYEDTFFIPNGIEFGKFKEAQKRTLCRNIYRVVYVGAVEWWSGLDLAIRALKLVIKSLNNVKFYIIGEHRTPYGKHLFELVRKLGLENHVVFLGKKPYDFVVEFLPKCGLGILTFPATEVTKKAFPYKVLEYCAAGLPVVMTRITALSKLIERFKAGIVCDVRDVECIAMAISDLLTNTSLWKEYSMNAIALASIFDVERLAKKEAEVIKRVSGYK